MRLNSPLDDALATASHVRVLRKLLSAPLGLPTSGREIARRAGLSHPTATKVLRDLEHQGLVRARRQVGAEGYTVNKKHVLVQPIEHLFEAEDAIPGRITDWMRALFEEHRDVKAAYLFGSAARGEMTRSSDIDIAVLAPGARADELEERLDSIVAELRERTGAPVQLIVATSSPDRFRGGRKRLWDRIASEGLLIKGPGLPPARRRR